MTRTHTKIISATRLAMISAAFVFVGLMAATTTADAAERQRIYNKNEFIGLCNNQRSKVTCSVKNNNCSCDAEQFVFVWEPPFNHAPNPVFALHHGPIAGDGGGNGGGQGANW